MTPARPAGGPPTADTPAARPAPDLESPPLLVLLARDDRTALLAAIDDLLRLAPERLTSAAQPDRGAERLAVIASSPAQLAERLALARARISAGPERARLLLHRHGVFFAAAARPGKVAFLFPGQGSQHPGMLADLRRRVPRVRTWFDTLDQVYLDAGYAAPSALLAVPAGEAPGRPTPAGLFELQRGGPLSIIADLALFELIRDLGVGADCVVGHSNGEHAAVFAAGRVPMDDPLVLTRDLLSVTRAADRLPPPPVPERMLALANLEPARLARLLGGRRDCWLAMDNCPQQQVVAGTAAACAALRPALLGADALVADLPFTRAYHTPLFADWGALLGAWYERLPLQPGVMPVVSCRDRRPLPAAAAACRGAMQGQWTAPVRFRETVLDLYRDGVRTFIEVGPDQKLSAFVADTLRGRPHLAVGTSATRVGDLKQLQVLLALLFVHGVALAAARIGPLLGTVDAAGSGAWAPPRAPAAPGLIDLASGVHRDLIARAAAGRDRLRGQLPPALARLLLPANVTEPSASLLGHRFPTREGTLLTRRRFTRGADPWVDDHALGRLSACTAADAYPLPVLAFTLALALAAQAGEQLGGRVRELREVRALRWLALDHGVLDLDIAAQRDPSGVRVRLSAAGESDAFTAVVAAEVSGPAPLITAPLAGRPPRRWTAERFYARYAFHGPSFQGLLRVLSVGPDGIAAELRTTALPGVAHASLALDPALLDCAGQLVAFWLLEQEGRGPDFGLFPVAAARVLLLGPPPRPGSRCLCRAAIRHEETGFTSAEVRFETAGGDPIAAIQGLRQRLIEVPDWLARALFGGAPVRLPADLRAARELLLGQGRIWQRVLAHLTLSAAERARWGQCRSAPEGADWLIRRLTQRAAASRAARPGQDRDPCNA